MYCVGEYCISSIKIKARCNLGVLTYMLQMNTPGGAQLAM